MRYLAMFIGALVIGAATHVTIHATGGYESAHAPLAIAIACGIAIGSICIGRAWSDRRWALAAFIALALLAGEAWSMLSTAERIIAAREASAEPARLLAINRKAAEQRLADAKANGSATSPRLEAAMLAKRSADAAVASEASKKGCAVNCRALLNKAVDDAANEVSAARREIESERASSRMLIAKLEAELAALPSPKSETPLADKIGWQGWALDLLAAGLASLAANGLGAALLAYGAHQPHRSQPSARADMDIGPVTLSAPQIHVAQPIRKIVEIQTPNLRATTNANEHAAKFGVDCLHPSPSGRTPISQIHAAYLDWCAEMQTPPLPSSKIGGALAALFEDTPGLGVEDIDGRLYVTGVSVVAQPVRMLNSPRRARA